MINLYKMTDWEVMKYYERKARILKFLAKFSTKADMKLGQLQYKVWCRFNPDPYYDMADVEECIPVPDYNFIDWCKDSKEIYDSMNPYYNSIEPNQQEQYGYWDESLDSFGDPIE